MEIITNRNKWFLISLGLIVIGLAVMLVNVALGRGAFNYDVQFKGGTEFTITFNEDPDVDNIRAIVTELTGQPNPQVVKILGGNEVSIVIQTVDQSVREEIIAKLVQTYSLPKANINYQDISATISGEMQRSAVQAILAACVIILAYVSFRFKNIVAGGSAIIALAHDVIIVVLSYAVFRIPLNYSFIAALLTILGYSINATIIIFDRIRENRSLLRRSTNEETINVSITQTLKRCLYTSITTLFTTVTLYIFGVTSIKEFMLPIIVGIVCGTYSSIFISGSVWYVLTVGPKKAFARAR
ncbi:MAG: protein translocase subunit SecF [Clostridiales bacterium]|jgi:preprotein translocase SecF subunit|nr:protein translocase subunit SecF [Clostridiales bacterium]